MTSVGSAAPSPPSNTPASPSSSSSSYGSASSASLPAAPSSGSSGGSGSGGRTRGSSGGASLPTTWPPAACTAAAGAGMRRSCRGPVRRKGAWKVSWRRRTLVGPMPGHAASCSGEAVISAAREPKVEPSVTTSTLFTPLMVVSAPAGKGSVRSRVTAQLDLGPRRTSEAGGVVVFGALLDVLCRFVLIQLEGLQIARHLFRGPGAYQRARVHRRRLVDLPQRLDHVLHIHVTQHKAQPKAARRTCASARARPKRRTIATHLRCSSRMRKNR